MDEKLTDREYQRAMDAIPEDTSGLQRHAKQAETALREYPRSDLSPKGTMLKYCLCEC